MRQNSAAKTLVMKDGCLFRLFDCVCHLLLPALEDLDHAISANMVQILMLFYHTAQIASASSDPDHPADILGCTSV